YPYGVELRPTLGTGGPPGTVDLRRAVRVSRAVQLGSALLSAALAVAVGQHRHRFGFGFGLRLGLGERR
nr:hypothetical protein [Actinomycetota bacterium]